MRKLMSVALLIALPVVSRAQGFYFRTGFGYAMPMAGQSIDGAGTPYNGTLNNNTAAFKIKGASFTAGVQGYIGCGYMLNKNIGVQLDANLGVANKRYTFTADNVTLGGGVPGSVKFEMQAAGPLIISPSLVLQSGGDKWNLYTRMGIAIPLATEVIRDEIQSNAPGSGTPIVDDFTFSMKSYFSLGLTAAAGVKYKLNSRVTLWGEVSMLSLSCYLKESRLTGVTENGQSYPLTAVQGNQVVKYSKNIVADSTGANLPTYSLPFSNMGINVGINLSISRGSRRSTGEGRSNNGKSSGRPKPSRFR